MKKIAILGSTGSIGTQTLSVVREHGDIEVTALAAGHNIAKLEEQIREFHPALVAVWAEEDAIELRTRVADLKVKVASGMEGLLEVATEEKAEILVTAIVGMLGIRPTIAAMKAGKDIALANKETLVTAGHIIMPLAKECNVKSFQWTVNTVQFFSLCREPETINCKNTFDSFRRTIPWKEAVGIRTGKSGRCIEASELEHGT